MAPGAIFLFVSLEDQNWADAGTALILTVILGLLGYGFERLWFYVNRHPGGTRWSKFWIGR
jgi:hypothetical protein